MKRFNLTNSELYIGTASEIRHLCRNLWHREHAGKPYASALFGQFPSFSPNKYYGLAIEDGLWSVLSERATLAYLLYDDEERR